MDIGNRELSREALKPSDGPELRERLAALSHEIWADWMKYQFSKCAPLDFRLTIPEWAVTRWSRQINTPYAELSEAEKALDREQADKILGVLNEKS